MLHIHRERSIESLLKEHTGIILKVCAMYVPYRHPHSEEWREEVRDLFQEIALNLCESWPQFRGQCSESTWVYRVATNVAISNLRRTSRSTLFIYCYFRFFAKNSAKVSQGIMFLGSPLPAFSS